MKMSHDSPFDTGLQLERTLLAWRRTYLALAVTGAVGSRLIGEVFGSLAVIFGVFCVGAAAGGYLRVLVRYRRANASLVATGRLLTDGVAQLLSLASLLLIWAGALVYVCTSISMV